MSSSPSSCENGYPEVYVKVTGPAAAGTISWAGQTWDLSNGESGQSRLLCPAYYKRHPHIATANDPGFSTHNWGHSGLHLFRKVQLDSTAGANHELYSIKRTRHIDISGQNLPTASTDMFQLYRSSINDNWHLVTSYCFLSVYCGAGTTAKGKYSLNTKMIGSEDEVSFTDSSTNVTYSWFRGNGDWDAIVN